MNDITVVGVILLGGFWNVFVTHCQGVDSPNPKCPVSSYACHNSTVCISDKYQCDGDSDCPHGDDEEGCDYKVSGCGDVSRQNGIRGNLSSMGYPSTYYNEADCKWRLQAPDGWGLTLVFDDLFELEKPRHGRCVYDRVSVFQDDPLVLIGDYCGKQRPPTLHINTSQAVVEFTTDRDNVFRGFRISWFAQKPPTVPPKPSPRTSPVPTPSTDFTVCPFIVTMTGARGTFQSPAWTPGQSTGSPVTCKWIISLEPGYFIYLQFAIFHLSDKFPPSACGDASLTIYDGPNHNSPPKEKLCGYINPGGILSTSNSMYLVLTAPNGLRNGTKFVANYIARAKEPTTTLGPPPLGCNGDPITLTSPHGFITSPNYDGVTPYRVSIDCSWLLIGTPGKVFKFSFQDFSVETSSDCRFDYLRISDQKDGRDESGVGYLNSTLCKERVPRLIESKTPNVTILFHSDDQLSGTGFNMSYRLEPPTVVCPEDEFKCGDKECIDNRLVCDGVPACKDGSDEIICYNTSSCGKPPIEAILRESRIVGGAEALEGAWPWTLSLLDPENVHLCGASLILPQWVITAAHCFRRAVYGHYKDYSVIGGRHELRHPSKNEQRRFIEDVFMPSDYVSSTSENDIAVIKLVSPFDLSDTISTVCLPEAEVETGQYGWVAGWGATMGTGFDGKLKQATVPVINDTLCHEFYGSDIYAHMMCCGFPQGGADTCGGDSGGPFVVERKQDGRWELQGVTSWGELCGSPGKPGVYTKAYDFIRWIQQTIAANQT